jgi:hypothetical protein
VGISRVEGERVGGINARAHEAGTAVNVSPGPAGSPAKEAVPPRKRTSEVRAESPLAVAAMEQLSKFTTVLS